MSYCTHLAPSPGEGAQLEEIVVVAEVAEGKEEASSEECDFILRLPDELLREIFEAAIRLSENPIETVNAIRLTCRRFKKIF